MHSPANAQSISARKQALTARIADQRLLVSGLFAEVQPLIGVADKGIAAIRWVRANAAWLGVGLGLIAPILLANRRPAGRVALTLTGASALVWVRRSVVAYQAFKQLRKLIADRRESAEERRPSPL